MEYIAEEARTPRLHQKSHLILPKIGKLKIETNRYSIGFANASSHFKDMTKKSSSKKISFMELMGYHQKHKSAIVGSPLNIEISTPTISLTDFMGSKKMSFLQQTGFLEIYDKCKRSEGLKKLIDRKNTLSLPNIVHYDLIRKNSFKSEHSPIKNDVSHSFEPKKYEKKGAKKTGIDKIAKIIKDCEELYVENRKLREMTINATQSTKNIFKRDTFRTTKKRLTIKELNAIRMNQKQLDN